MPSPETAEAAREDNLPPLPELPETYQRTHLEAMPCDPFRTFLYWEIADTDWNSMLDLEGGDLPQRAESVIRAYDQSGHLLREFPVQLDKKCVYISLEAQPPLLFELGFRVDDQEFVSLAHTGSLSSLPPSLLQLSQQNPKPSFIQTWFHPPHGNGFGIDLPSSDEWPGSSDLWQ